MSEPIATYLECLLRLPAHVASNDGGVEGANLRLQPLQAATKRRVSANKHIGCIHPKPQTACCNLHKTCALFNQQSCERSWCEGNTLLLLLFPLQLLCS